MGKSGQGKTTILKELTGLDLKVGKELKSGKHTPFSFLPVILCQLTA